MGSSASAPTNAAKRVLIVGGGFAGLTAARGLARERGVEVTLLDRRNHHLFQPLLYQVAMAGLSPAEIAAPIRALVRGAKNVSVRQEEAIGADLERRILRTRAEGHEHEHAYDYLVLACGAGHAYFGRDEWEEHAPGLKTLEQALEIRRRVLSAYESAELEGDAARQRALLTFVVVGGGPTGVELAGALGEMSRFTLARDFRNIDPALARVMLIEAGPRILPSFPETLARRAMRDLEALGVQVWTASPVTRIDATGVDDQLAAPGAVAVAVGLKHPQVRPVLGLLIEHLHDRALAGRLKRALAQTKPKRMPKRHPAVPSLPGL